MIDHINRPGRGTSSRSRTRSSTCTHDKRSIVNQREVGSDTESFGRAMRRVLRQDPDVILIGEMRDEETVRTALSAAETGHLVLSTVHTLDATETINRIIDFFPPHLQQQARVMLASTLKGAIAQRLVPDVTGEGRVAASEVMVVTGRVQDLILNPEETGKITEVIAEGEYYGMRTFDQSLLGYAMEGRITEEVALDYASSPHDFKLMLAAGGQRASGIEQLERQEPVAAVREKLNDNPIAQVGLIVVLVVVGVFMFISNSGGGEEEAKRRRPKRPSPSPAPAPSAPPPARRPAKRSKARSKARSKRVAKRRGVGDADLGPGAAAAQRRSPPPTTPARPSSCWSSTTAASTTRWSPALARSSTALPDVAALHRPGQADRPLRGDHRRRSTSTRCRRWS